VKVCGIRRLDDAQLAVELGASAVGFVFWRRSPRYVEPELARTIAAALPEGVMVTGVFVDQPTTEVTNIADAVGLDAIQLHGGEAVGEYAALPQRLIKAVAIDDQFDPARIDVLPDDVAVLLDAHDPVRRGGTGRTIDWNIAAAIAARRETILSGGLNAANIADAVARVRPHMIDVSSGVEAAPGRKDPRKLREFFAAIQSVSIK
jgi:phosphoribosylanthranilate isomerase